MNLFNGSGQVIEIDTESKTNGFDEEQVNLIQTSDFIYGQGYSGAGVSNATNANMCYVEFPIEYGEKYYSNIGGEPCKSYENPKLENGMTGLVLLIDKENNLVEKFELGSRVLKYDSAGIGLYENWASFTNNQEKAVKARLYVNIKYSLTIYNDINGVFSDEFNYPNINCVGHEYLTYEYGHNIMKLSDDSFNGTMEQLLLSNKATNYIQQMNLKKNPLYGKTVYMIGDSNGDNWVSGCGSTLSQQTGCIVKGYASYGATWGTNDGEDSTVRNNAIGQYNQMVSDLGIDSSTFLFPSDAVFLFMMGTNTATGGVGTIGVPVESTSLDVSTDIGAMHYILKRMAYYARGNRVGVILPWQGDRGDKHGNSTKNEALKALCQYYAIPCFDLMSIMINDTPTSDLVRPDGTKPSNNYYSDGGVHFATYGKKRIENIMHYWIMHCI